MWLGGRSRQAIHPGVELSLVLVTGAEGFIGSHLTEHLVRQGHSVRAMVLYNSFGKLGWLEGSEVVDSVEVVLGDVRDPDSAQRALDSVDTVYHLAALIAIPYSYQAPRSYVDTNIMGTLNVCQAALRSGVSMFLQMSTSEVYGNADSFPISEGHALRPQSPYAASKVGADAVAQSFRASFDLPLCIARPFNTYGPRQSTRAFIPAVMSQVLVGADELRVGDLRPTRDLTFVSDTVSALARLGETGPTDGSTIHVGTGIEYSMMQVVQAIQRLAGTSIPVIQEHRRFRPESSEVFRLVADNSRLRQETGFTPDTDLETGLLKTMEWLQAQPRAGWAARSGYTL